MKTKKLPDAGSDSALPLSSCKAPNPAYAGTPGSQDLKGLEPVGRTTRGTMRRITWQILACLPPDADDTQGISISPSCHLLEWSHSFPLPWISLEICSSLHSLQPRSCGYIVVIVLPPSATSIILLLFLLDYCLATQISSNSQWILTTH